MSTLNVTAIKDASGGNTATINGMTPTASSLQGFRNRIINGGMDIDQRNAGAAVTINTTNYTYAVDRWSGYGAVSDGVFTLQQSTTAPSNFVNSLKVTVTTADASIGASQFYIFEQFIEGLNVADLGWGTSAAQTVTLSFWVRASVTGSFSGSVSNDAFNRSYPFSFTINSANTFEYKTITIPGDTTGTWLTTNGIGIRLYFDLGSGSSNKGTASTWAAAGYVGATSSVNLISTVNATLYITGVQLEAGSVATPFERRPYGTELALCQRYYETSYDIGSAVGTNTSNGLVYTVGRITASTVVDYVPSINFKVTKRTAPGLSYWTAAGGSNQWNGPSSAATPSTNSIGQQNFAIYITGQTGLTTGQAGTLYGHWAASAEL